MMPNAKLISALFLVGLFLSGCESHLDQNYKLTDAHRGIVMVNVAHSQSVEGDQAILYIRRYDPATGKLMLDSKDYWEAIRLKTGFGTQKQTADAEFFVTDAFQGSYVIDKYVVVSGNVTNNFCMGNGTVAFDVKPGAITYLGNYAVAARGVSFAGLHEDLARAELARHPNLTALPLETGLKSARVAASSPGPDGCFTDDARVTLSQLNQPSAHLNVNISNAYISMAAPPSVDGTGARERGDSLVKGAGVKDVFENVTTGSVTTVRHRPSGLLCVNPQVVLTPKAQASAFDPEGQTGCINGTTGVQSALMVVPNSGSLSAAQALAALMQREKRLQPALEARNGGDALDQAHSGAAYAVGSLASSAGASSRYVHFVVATKNGWVVFAQTSGSQDEAATCDRVAEAELNRAIADIHKPGG